MLVVRSVSVVTLMAAGRLRFDLRKQFQMLLTTVMVFAPGCLWTFTMTAGVLFIHAACWLFSTPFTTAATFFRNTGALLC